MAASIYVELESGTSAGRVHPHNGYYAGDFTGPRNTRYAVRHPSPTCLSRSCCVNEPFRAMIVASNAFSGTGAS